MGEKMPWLWLVLAGCILICLPVLPLQAQDLPTATPDAEGLIYAVVQPNDSLWAIASRAGISLSELLALNNLSEDAIIQPGDRLIVGFGPPPGSPTPEVSPTAVSTRPPPTPTQTPPPPPPTALCLVAFTDENGNGQREPQEPLQAGVAFTVFTSEGVVANYVTDGSSEPYCLTDLVPDDYQITRSVGREERLTNSGNRTVILSAGDQVMLGFGGFFGEAVPPTPTAVAPTGPPAFVGDEATAPTPEEPAPLPANNQNRALVIGTGILIGILLIGAAVLIGRQRS